MDEGYGRGGELRGRNGRFRRRMLILHGIGGRAPEAWREVSNVERKGILWVAVVVALVMLAFTVPYTLLRGLDVWYGSFLFWSVFAAVAIAVNVLIMRGWKD